LEGEIDEDQMKLLQAQGISGSKKKVLANLREKQLDSSTIQLKISYSSLTMI